ncbi:hypothetical protein KI387_000031, partial [Taxus chinensis]
STKPSVDKVLQVVKHLTMGDSAMAEDKVMDLLGELGLEARFHEEESKEVQLECAYIEKEKGNLVYVINGEDVENLNVNHR